MMTSTSTLLMARTTKRFKFIDPLARIKIKIGVGQGWFHEIRNAVLIGASLKVLLELNISIAVVLTFLLMIAFYLAGEFDIKVLKLYQRINELSATDYNPQLNKITQIEKSLNSKSTLRK